MDAPGIREELRDMARRLATTGYYVLLPNLYYRAGRDTTYGPDVLVHGSPEHRAHARRAHQDDHPAGHGRRRRHARLRRRASGRKRGPVGVHGYCMSGPYALAAAARYPDRIAAAASFYGTWLVSDAVESPHLSLGKAKGELYIACAEHDDLAPLPMVEELRAPVRAGRQPRRDRALSRRAPRLRLPAAQVYDKPAAERHWERLIALYRRRLG